MEIPQSNPHSPSKPTTPAPEAPVPQETLPSSAADQQEISRLLIQSLTKLPSGH